MRDIERDVKDLLQSMADEATDLGGLPRDVQRRARLRRAAMVVGSAALVVGLVVGGGSVASSLLTNGTSPAGPRPTPRGDEHGAPRDLNGDLVATGTFDGGRWWLSAYMQGENDLCTELTTEEADGSGGSGGSCGRFDPVKHPIGLGVDSGGGAVIASGHVPEHVERLDLILGSGERVSVKFYEKPEGFPLPVKFYVIVPFPEDEAQELIAYDDSGAEVDRQEIFNSSDAPTISRVAGPFIIDEGEHQGIPYVFKGHVEEQELSEGGSWAYPCHEFMLGRHERFGGGGGCDIPLARGHAVNFSQASFEAKPDIIAIHGAAWPEVDRVTVELETGEVFDAEVHHVKDVEFTFFLVFPDVDRADLVGDLVAYSGSNELDRVELCDPEFASLGSACGP